MLGSKIKQEIYYGKGLDSSLKGTSTPLKPQIQGPKTKERKKSGRKLPLDC